MKKVLSILQFGAAGIALSELQAHQDPQAALSRADGEDWTPYLMKHGKWRAIVIRKPSSHEIQWGHMVLADHQGNLNLNVQPDCPTRHEAIRAAARHLAQLEGHYNGIEQFLSEQERDELDQSFIWQATYNAARSRGMDDEVARQHAFATRRQADAKLVH